MNQPKTEPMDDCRLDQIEEWLAADPYDGGVIRSIRALDIRALVARMRAEEERIAELERDRDVLLVELQRSFMKLPTVPGDAIAWDGRNLDPHVVRCADEFAVLREQRDAAHKRIADLGRKVALLTAERDSLEKAIDEIRRKDEVRADSTRARDIENGFIEQTWVGRGPNSPAALRLSCERIAELEAENQTLRSKHTQRGVELRKLQVAQEDRNRQLDAMHWVWCSGGCEPKVPLTREIVETAVRNTERMVRKFNNVEFKVLPLHDRFFYNDFIKKARELEAYQRACRKIQQWIGDDASEVDEAVVRRVEGDARKLAALEAREAELVGALTALHQSVVDWNAAVESVIGRKPYDPMQDAMKLAGEVLAKGRKEVGDE
jgi:hypothetical protein